MATTPITSKSSSFLHSVGQINNGWTPPLHNNTPTWYGQNFISTWWESKVNSGGVLTYFSGSLQVEADYLNTSHSFGFGNGSTTIEDGPLKYAGRNDNDTMAGAYSLDSCAVSESTKYFNGKYNVSASIIHSGSHATVNTGSQPYYGYNFQVEGGHEWTDDKQDFVWHRVNNGAGFKLMSIVILGSTNFGSNNGNILVYNTNPAGFDQLANDIGLPCKSVFIPNPATGQPFSKSVIDLVVGGGISVYNMAVDYTGTRLVSTLPSFSAGSVNGGNNGWKIHGR